MKMTIEALARLDRCAENAHVLSIVIPELELIHVEREIFHEKALASSSA